MEARSSARPDGLDLDVLRGLRGRSRPVEGLLERIENHLQRWGGYVAFSGGKDSLVVLDLVRRVDPDVPVVFFDSGLEYPQTYTYLEQLTDRWRINLVVIPATPSLLEILVAGGRWDHHAPAEPGSVNLHEILIAAPAAAAHARFGPGELWGVRSGESNGRRTAYAQALKQAGCNCLPPCATAEARRARHGGVIARVDGTVAYSPIWDWPTPAVWEHLACHHLKVNPAYEILRRIGAPEESLRISHLLDATRLEEGRITWLRRGWPDLFDELATLLPCLREYI